MPDAGSNLKRRSFLDREADFGYNIPESGITVCINLADRGPNTSIFKITLRFPEK